MHRRFILPMLLLTFVAAGCSLSYRVSTPGTTSTAAPSSTPPSSPADLATTYSLIQEPRMGYQPIYSLLASAQRSLTMTMYELQDLQAEKILAADAQRGVQVRVLLDKAYKGEEKNQTAFAFLRAHGVAVRWALANTIFHQKTFTVDESTSVIGTANLTAQYYSTSIDAWVVIHNSKDIAAIQSTFTQDWAGAQGPPKGLPGTNLVWSPGAQTAMVLAIKKASSSVMYESEELSDSTVINALATDAQHGVHCEILMTSTNEWTKAFQRVTAAGCLVHTFAYGGSTPYVHEKAVIVNAGKPTAYTLIGSTNGSVASLVYNRELSILLAARTAPQVVSQVASNFANNFSTAPPWALAHSS